MSTESNKIPAVEKSNPCPVPVKCLNENCKFYGYKIILLYNIVIQIKWIIVQFVTKNI